MNSSRSSAGAATASLGSPRSRAGYRLGTTRTVQPGESGAPPPGRTANSSGGVRPSLPAANGSPAGSICSGGAHVGAPPGRRERPPATIVLCPLSGSILSSGTFSAGEGVASHVLFELGGARVGALVDELAAAAVVEDGHGREAGVGDREPCLPVGVVVAGIADRVGVQEAQ